MIIKHPVNLLYLVVMAVTQFTNYVFTNSIP